jgi:hypothetical protein
MASRARAYLENLPRARARKGVARRLSRAELEQRLEGELSVRGENYVNTLRDDARKLASSLGLVDELKELDTLIGALLGTRDARLHTERGSARAAGMPYDPKRLELFGRLHTDLLKEAPAQRLEPSRPGEERYLPFFEAYFSNFIEGTEFEVDEAAAIIFDGRIPRDRPEDAHDVLGTFSVVSDPSEMRQTPAPSTARTALASRTTYPVDEPPRAEITHTLGIGASGSCAARQRLEAYQLAATYDRRRSSSTLRCRNVDGLQWTAPSA